MARGKPLGIRPATKKEPPRLKAAGYRRESIIERSKLWDIRPATKYADRNHLTYIREE
jgi:hypothetical protein